MRVHTRHFRSLLAGSLALLLFLGGCASPVFTSRETEGADRSVSFRELAEHPHSFAGRHVLLGGEILSVARQGIVGTVAVRERPLGPDDRPDFKKPSRGVFLVRTDRPLSEDLYRAGRTIEVVGKVLKPEWQTDVGGKKVLVPVVRARTLHVDRPATGGMGGYPGPYYSPGWFYPYGPAFF